MDYYDLINTTVLARLNLNGRTDIYYRIGSSEKWKQSRFVGTIKSLVAEFPSIQLATKRTVMPTKKVKPINIPEWMTRPWEQGVVKTIIKDDSNKPKIPYRYEEIKDDEIKVVPSMYFKYKLENNHYYKCSGYDWFGYKQKLFGFTPPRTETIKQFKEQNPKIIFFKRTRKPRFKCSKPYPWGY